MYSDSVVVDLSSFRIVSSVYFQTIKVSMTLSLNGTKGTVTSITIHEELVGYLVRHLDVHKLTGPDGIHPKVLR